MRVLTANIVPPNKACPLSPASMETTSQLCIAALGVDIVPIVRVPECKPEYVSRVLDGGADF